MRRSGRPGVGLGGVAIILLAWQAGVWLTGVNSIVLPSPVSVAIDMATNPGLYASNAAETVVLVSISC